MNEMMCLLIPLAIAILVSDPASGAPRNSNGSNTYLAVAAADTGNFRD